MKTKTLFSLLVFVSVITNADDLSAPGKLNGFLGMHWGTPVNIADDIMGARKGCSLAAGVSTDSVRFYVGGAVADYEVNFVRLDFSKRGLEKAMVRFNDSAQLNQFGDLLKILTGKYGSPSVHSAFLAKWPMASQCIILDYLIPLHDSPFVRLVYSNKRLEDTTIDGLDIPPKPVTHSQKPDL